MISEEQAVPRIHQTIEYVTANFPSDIIQIFDSPPGTSCPVIEAVRNVDLVVLVIEPTPFGLHDLKLAVETVRQLGRDFVVVLNRHGIGDDKVERYCEAEDIELAACIPNSRRTAETYAAGKLLYREIPEVATAVETVARIVRSRNGSDRP